MQLSATVLINKSERVKIAKAGLIILQKVPETSRAYLNAKVFSKYCIHKRKLNLKLSAMSSEFAKEKSILIEKARTILRGERKSRSELNLLCKELEIKEEFSYATDLLLTRLEQDQAQGISATLEDHQVLAKYIYKDQSLPSTFKFERALRELRLNGLDGDVRNCETLGLAGAIYKRKWQFDNQFKNLELSDYYYKRGYQCWKFYLETISKKNKEGEPHPASQELNDDGYTAINHAYTTELMAILRLRELGTEINLADATEKALENASEIRKFILDQFITSGGDVPQLKSDNYHSWVIASVAEAYFGLKEYEHALKFICQYREREKRDINENGKPGEILSWKIKTFTQQIVSIATSQRILKKQINTLGEECSEKLWNHSESIDEEKIRECLEALGWVNKSGSDDSGYGEKKGLALSGGGFRAALFHIGVLASLAEHDKLRNIEVISCVSGGSIIGAFYHLKLRKLLEEKEDAAIVREDYITIVKEIEDEFLKGVQKNLRMRIFSNLFKNFKMLRNDYSRSHRLGELYEKHLYSPLLNGNKKILMKELFINPKGTKNFSIDLDNWSRRNKVPQLILNATSVNTGHNWQFTASWMGEPPGSINDDIDVKPRLRRMYYNDAPGVYREFRLGYAVAASSCVPVMFEPLPMKNLYPDIDLQLIDGGLHDNQGIASLLEQECRNIFISDASGQLPSSTESTGNEASLFFRADNILQERLREIQFMDLEDRHATAQISVFNKVHLKSGLLVNPVSWINCSDPPRKLVYEKNCPQDSDLTNYGILRTVQQKLSELRTDLDSFNDIESYALMYSGYRQTEMELKSGEKVPGNWRFLQVEKYVAYPEKAVKIMKVLTAGKKLAFKLLDLSTAVKVVAGILSLFVLLLTTCFVIHNWSETVIQPVTVKILVTAIGLYVIGVFSKPLGMALNMKAALRKYGLVLFAVVLGFIVCLFYIVFLNPIYNRIGKIK